MLLESSSELKTTLGLKKKLPPKFFGYVLSTVVSWIFSLSKNVTRAFPRIHPRGPELSTVLLHFTKKFPSKFFMYV